MSILVGAMFAIPAIVGGVAGAKHVEDGLLGYFVSFGAVAMLVAIFVVFHLAKIGRRRRFVGREVLTIETWRHQCSMAGVPEDVVQKILQALAVEIGGRIQPTQILASDRLEDFSPTFWGVPTEGGLELAEAELECSLDDLIGLGLPCETVSDLICGVAIVMRRNSPAATD